MGGSLEWSWQVFFHYLVNGEVLRGALTTVWLTATGLGIGTIAGSLLTVFATIENPIPRALYSTYTFVVTGTPLLVQLVLVYNGLPQAGITLGVLASTLVALGVNESAYMAEIIRGGINSVPPGQMEAAKALGMTRVRAMRVVILPQAVRAAIPPAGNEVNGLLKSTSLVSVISMTELFRTTQDIYAATFRVLELLVVATVYYLVLSAIWRFVQVHLERHFSAPQSTVRQPRTRARLPRNRIRTLVKKKVGDPVGRE